MGSRSNADNGPSYGAPTSTPAPGKTTRARPKVGDKNPNYKPPARKPKVKTETAPRKIAKADNELVQRRDSKNRPVGGGGHSRDITMMDKVDELQTGKKKK